MTVIATLELQNQAASGRGTGYTQSTHHRFRSRRHKPQHLDPRQPRSNPLGQLKRIRFAGAKAPGGRDRFLYSCGDVRIAMAQQQWAKALTEIDVLTSVDGRHRPALRAAKENG